MMKRIVEVVGVLAMVGLVTAGGVGSAAAQPPTEVPKPPPQNDLMKKSSGNWTCQGTTKAPDGQEMKYKATWTVKPSLGGHWFNIVYKRAKMGPVPAFEGHATVGYDTVDKKYTMVGFDSWGGWIDLSSSDGAVFTGDAGDAGKKLTAKFSFSPGKDKKGEESDRLFDVVMEFSGNTASESCKK